MSLSDWQYDKATDSWVMVNGDDGTVVPVDCEPGTVVNAPEVTKLYQAFFRGAKVGEFVDAQKALTRVEAAYNSAMMDSLGIEGL